MAQMKRQTQAIGGESGAEFRAPEDSDVSQLTLYCEERLNGIEVTYSNDTVQKIGNINGRVFNVANSVSDPIRTIFVYTNKDSSMVVGIRIILRRGTGTTYGRETEHLRSVAFPAHSRLTGINGRHQPLRIVALSFTYFAAAEAFDPGVYQGRTASDRLVDTVHEAEKNDRGRDLENQIDRRPLVITLCIVGGMIGIPYFRNLLR